PAPPPGVPDGLTKCTRAYAAWCGSLEVPLDRTGKTAGTVTIDFQYFPARETTNPRTTLVAHEGGPGYSTTDGEDYFLDLFAPLMDTRAALLVDERGTGLSDPINCPEAQSYNGDWVENARLCGQRLGDAADLYTTANAAADMADVLDYLGIDKIDLYGDSYGSFFAQTFTTRYPQYVRTAIFDATYPITGLDPWYATTAQRLRENVRLFCAKSPATCPVAPREMLPLLADVVETVRDEPIRTTAPDWLGYEVPITITPRRVMDALLYTDVTPGYVREVPAALIALLDGNPRPFARMIAEVEGASADAVAGKMGIPRPNQEIRFWSEGAYLAYACSDYPQLWDKQAGPAERQRQFADAVDDLDPRVTRPWTPEEWASSDFFVYDYCIGWPKPDAGTEPPFPNGGQFPNTPVLVLNGDLDLRTDVYQAREVAENFPNSTYVEVPNFGHVNAIYDADKCASVIARTFIETRSVGNTSCLSDIPEHRTAAAFAETASGIPQATVASGRDQSTARDRRAAYVAMESVSDVVDRWYAIPGYTGSGLYGGQFSMYTTSTDPFVSRIFTLKLNHLRWVRDIQVTGTGSIPRANGPASVTVTIRGAGTDKGSLEMHWHSRAKNEMASVTGTIGGRRIDVLVPAPSYY
ncbi:MAG TPA: alpha/beta fold hydrolase, partial [Actinomycetes bacterium]|nr:alpha/beta fold hydrolase [Actinomycetes bacterium]